MVQLSEAAVSNLQPEPEAAENDRHWDRTSRRVGPRVPAQGLLKEHVDDMLMTSDLTQDEFWLAHFFEMFFSCLLLGSRLACGTC